jgi:hypothetical protein
MEYKQLFIEKNGDYPDHQCDDKENNIGQNKP